MLRRSLTAAIVSLLLSVGLLTAAPSATARERYDNSIGIITAPDQRYQGRGCNKYLVRWNFNPPTEEWSVLMRIRTPKRFSIRSELFDSGYTDKMGQEVGRKRFPLCGASVKPGQYKIEMQMIYTVGRDTVTKNRAPVFFRLMRRR